MLEQEIAIVDFRNDFPISSSYLVLLGLDLLGSQRTDWDSVGTKEFVASVQNNVRNTGQNSSHEGSEPVDKVVGVVIGVFAIGSNSKDIPGGRKHWVHGRASGGEKLDESANGNRRKELLNDVVVLAKVELPVELQIVVESELNL